MRFDFDITVPAGTLKDDPLVTPLKLTSGNIAEIGVFFPPGCAALVYARLRRGLQQIAPANPEGAWNYDDIRIASRMEFPLDQPPYEVFVDCWSPGAIYAHTLVVDVDMQPKAEQDWRGFLQHLLGSTNA